MKKQLEQQEALLQNQDAMNNTMSQLYEKGLIKGNPDSGFEAVETMEDSCWGVPYLAAPAPNTARVVRELTQHRVLHRAPPSS